MIVMLIVKLQETTLAANQPLGAKRTRLNQENLRNSCQPETDMFAEEENRQLEDATKQTVAPLINLEPLQIRTFIATVSWY